MSVDSAYLKDFFSSYFHQDWMLDAPSWEGVVDLFVASGTPEIEIENLAALIRALACSGASDEALGNRLFREFGCFFDPRAEFSSIRSWLLAVSERLQSRVASRP